MKELNIGVLGLQGAIEEHIAATSLALNEMGLEGKVLGVKTPKEIQTIDGLIIPGGESTVMGRLSTLNQAFAAIKERISGGMPVMGTCAGMILLAKNTFDRVTGETEQPLLGPLDVVVERNAYGRQRESFEADLEIPVLGEGKYRGVFIRSPAIRETGSKVEVLCRLDSVAVAVRQDNIIGTAFHPELTADTRLHQLFVKAVVQRVGTGKTASC
jgi:5'-phosphate synthase pdxT subunit